MESVLRRKEAPQLRTQVEGWCLRLFTSPGEEGPQNTPGAGDAHQKETASRPQRASPVKQGAGRRCLAASGAKFPGAVQSCPAQALLLPVRTAFSSCLQRAFPYSPDSCRLHRLRGHAAGSSEAWDVHKLETGGPLPVGTTEGKEIHLHFQTLIWSGPWKNVAVV